MPQSIAKTNTMPWLSPKPREAKAGPGHKPARPHPIPKSTEPIIRSGFILELWGSGNLSPNIGFRPFEYLHAKNMGTMAPPITKASVGSQLPNKSNHPCTFEVSVMPENNSPMPKREPDMKLVKPLIRLRPRYGERLKL